MYKNFLLISLSLFLLTSLTYCSDNDIPKKENPEEIMTDVTLIFTPSGNEPIVMATASDPDAEGPDDIQVDSTIQLRTNVEYTLTIEIINTIAGTILTDEIRSEAGEHMFFFEWTDGLFVSPEGNGNVDNRSDTVNYLDVINGLPLGLSTTWTPGDPTEGRLRILLKHQPGGIKSLTSTALDGETDLDLTWDILIL